MAAAKLVGVLGRQLRASLMQTDNQADIARTLANLRQEHRDLDAVIAHLSASPGNDELRMSRLKKRKLSLKDAIARLESRLIPDLDA